MDKSYIIDYLNDNFEYRILKRGFDYYRDDHIEEARMIDENTYLFYVEGTYLYQVEVNVGNGEIIDLDCSCPYAVNDNCKHMAAALFYMGENDIEPSEQEAAESREFRNFKRRVLSELGSLDNIYDSDLDEDDETCDHELIEVVKKALDEVKRMISRRDYKLAVDCILFLYSEIRNIDANIIEGTDRCKLLIDKEFAKIVDKDIDLVIERLTKAAIFERYSDCDYLDVIADNLNDRENALKFYSFMDDLEGLCVIMTNNYMRSKAMVVKFKLSIRFFPDKVKKILNDNIDNYEVFRIYLNNLMSVNDVEKIKEVMIHLGRYTLHERSEIKKLLKYFNNGDFAEESTEDYISRFKIFPNRENYNELLEELSKDELSRYDDEIEKAILDRSRDFDLYKEYCIDNDKIGSLFAEAAKSLDNLMNNYDLFKDDFSEEMMQQLVHLMKDEIDRAVNRKQYQKIVGYILTINGFENSSKTVDEIIEYIRKKYYNRSALIDEIDFFELMYKGK